jgi:SAM-dependent methyltransferase
MVMEIGCGTGLFTKYFAVSGAHIIAVDISRDLLEIAKTQGLPEDRVEFVEKRFEECNIQGPFDAVIGSSALHHLDVDHAVSKIFDMLKPGGRLSFAEPNILNPQVFIERKFRFLESVFWYVSPDETAFYESSLRHLLRRIGFVDVCIRPFDWLHPATPEPMIEKIEKLGRLFESTLLIKEFAGSLIINARRP